MSRLKNLSLNSSRKLSTVTLISLLIICLGGLVVRYWGLSEYALSDDELWHLMVSKQKSIWELIQYNFHEEVHPPLSNIVWYFALKISDNDLWLRSISIVSGIALIPSAYVFAHRYIGGKVASYAAALIFAFAAMPLSMSVIIRAYSMMMLALMWAAIFAHKYCACEQENKLRLRYLTYYFLTCLVAVELNHASVFAIFALGLVLFFYALIRKNKQDFLIIGAIHSALMLMVISYLIVLQKIFGFHSNLNVFSDKSLFGYFSNYMKFFSWFLIDSKDGDGVAQIISVFSFFTILFVPISLIKNRKWLLLSISLSPVIANILTDYFRIYPQTVMQRHSLPLFFSVIIFYSYACQGCWNFCLRFCNQKWSNNQEYSKKYLQPMFIAVVTVAICSYIVSKNFLRGISPNCVEFVVKKSDEKLLDSELDKKDSEHNVFVTNMKNIWRLRWLYGEDKIKILTKNLAKFETKERTVYFSFFPARERSIGQYMVDYQLFFSDLFEYLKTEQKLNQVKSITFFDFGLEVDFLTNHLHPQFIPQFEPFMNFKDKINHKVWQEGYKIGWTASTSKEVLDRFYFRDTKFCCGRMVAVYSFTPKFISDEFINKKFITKYDDMGNILF